MVWSYILRNIELVLTLISHPVSLFLKLWGIVNTVVTNPIVLVLEITLCGKNTQLREPCCNIKEGNIFHLADRVLPEQRVPRMFSTEHICCTHKFDKLCLHRNFNKHAPYYFYKMILC